jgi:AcrR family transcriptional regulator
VTKAKPQAATAAGSENAAPDAGRPLRADARRNYDRLVVAARQVFTEQGAGAPMEAIARAADVGVGTLYRHFPKRIDIVEAVYRGDVDELSITAEKAVANLEPWPAVEAFVHAFARYAQVKRTLMSELQEAFEKHPELKLQSRERIEQAVDLVISRGQEAGVVRTDIQSPDVVQMIVPVCMSATMSPDQSERIMVMVLDGLRPPAKR